MIGSAYIRVSTDEQTEYSPDSQLRLIRDRAQKDGVVIPDDYIFADDGISGRSADKRPAFRMMIATAKQDPPPFQVIYVWKFSRFARNQEEAILYKSLLRKRGIDVRSISESTDSPFSSLIERIIEWMDEYYLINLAGEVRRGMKEKSLRGEATGKPPYGYDVKGKILVPNDDADAVREMFLDYASGVSLRSISAAYKMPITSLRYIMRNPAYIGRLRWDERPHDSYYHSDYRADPSVLPVGKHEPLIDRDLWDAVQDRLSKREAKYVRTEDYLLKGLVRCGSCGATLCRRGKGRMQCNRFITGKCKVSHDIAADRLMEMIVSQLEDIIDDPTYTYTPAPKKNYGKYIDAEKAKIRRAKAAYLAGAFSVEEYAEIKRSSEAVIAQYEEPVDYDEAKERTINVIEVLRSDAPAAIKNQALRSICDKIVFAKPDVDIYISFDS